MTKEKPNVAYRQCAYLDESALICRNASLAVHGIGRCFEVIRKVLAQGKELRSCSSAAIQEDK